MMALTLVNAGAVLLKTWKVNVSEFGNDKIIIFVKLINLVKVVSHVVVIVHTRVYL